MKLKLKKNDHDGDGNDDLAVAKMPRCRERPETAICYFRSLSNGLLAARMIRKIRVSSDWFGHVLLISFYIADVFSEFVI